MKFLFNYLIICLVFSLSLQSQTDFGQMYSTKSIQYWQGRYQSSNQEVYNVLFSFLTQSEKSSLRATKVIVNNTHEDDPFAFYTDGANIYTSAQSMMFLYDICLANAWLTLQGCDLILIIDYVAMMRYQARSNFVGNRYPTPLEALGIPGTTQDDREVDDLALSLFNSARAAIIAHEMGHIYHQHPGNNNSSRSQSRVHEKEADESALELLSRIHKIPIGMLLFFQIGIQYAPDSEAANHSTHPVNSDRIRNIATFLRTHIEDFAYDLRSKQVLPAKRAEVRLYAARFDTIAALLDDKDVLKGIQITAKSADPSTFKTCSAFSQDITKKGVGFSGYFQGEYVQKIPGEIPDTLSVVVLLQPSGKGITGSFNFGFGNVQIITGFEQKNKLYFSWKWNNINCNAVLYQNGTGQLIGTWGYRDNYDGGGTWRLQRK